jgi:hypothetical protein
MRIPLFLSLTMWSLLAPALVVGCGSDDASSPAPGASIETVEPSAESKALLSEMQGYASWPTFEENAMRKLSGGHGNTYVIAHHNEVVTQAVADGTLPLPDGAIVVKENYAALMDATPRTLTVMKKRAGGWYWMESTPQGKVVVDDLAEKGKPLEGEGVARCIGCHNSEADNDFVFTHPFH